MGRLRLRPGPLEANDDHELVEYEAGYGSPLNAHDTARGCMTVDEVARGILGGKLAEKKRPVMIEGAYRDHRACHPLPAWLADLAPPARREPATVMTPPGFVLVDVVLPMQGPHAQGIHRQALGGRGDG